MRTMEEGVSKKPTGGVGERSTPNRPTAAERKAQKRRAKRARAKASKLASSGPEAGVQPLKPFDGGLRRTQQGSHIALVDKGTSSASKRENRSAGDSPSLSRNERKKLKLSVGDRDTRDTLDPTRTTGNPADKEVDERRSLSKNSMSGSEELESSSPLPRALQVQAEGGSSCASPEAAAVKDSEPGSTVAANSKHKRKKKRAREENAAKNSAMKELSQQGKKRQQQRRQQKRFSDLGFAKAREIGGVGVLKVSLASDHHPTRDRHPNDDGVSHEIRGRETESEFVTQGTASKRAHKVDALLIAKSLDSLRKRHREEIGKGRLLVGWGIASFAQLAFEQVLSFSRTAGASNGVKMQNAHDTGDVQSLTDEDAEAVTAAVNAVTTSAEKEHAGKVTFSIFESLIREEAVTFSLRRRAGALLKEVLKQEQAGDLDAAESKCAECLAVWQGCGKGHLKMAQILRARGFSEQKAIRDVEFHLRQALACAVGAGERGEGDAPAELALSVAEKLSLLLCQEGRDKEAAEVLKQHGFRYRLARCVLRYPLPEATPSGSDQPLKPAESQRITAESSLSKRSISSNGSAATSGDIGHVPTRQGVDDAGEASRFVAAVDSALPPEMLGHLQEAFRSGSRFWSEHGYNSETGTPGYFSYIHSLDKPPSTSIEQIINRLKRIAESKFPEVREAKFVEWWAHRRPHSSGHQMHFDSDNEGKGGVRNPIISLVVYVTGDVGGPTLVTTQRLTSNKLADRGWIVHPRVNRVCMFDGGVLHGVIPGRGIPRSSSSSTLIATSDGIQGNNNPAGSDGGIGARDAIVSPLQASETSSQASALRRQSVSEERAGMRVTWMVAFWKEIQARKAPSVSNKRRPEPPPSGAGAAQPFPEIGTPGTHKNGRGTPQVDGRTWPALFRKKPEGWGGKGGWKGGTPVIPTAVPQVWEDVDVVENGKAGVGVRRLKRLPAYDLCFQGF